MADKGRILSGMRPTGRLHLGHLIGALNNWSRLQDDYTCCFMVADWHALMSEYAEPSRLRGDSREMIADWMATGLDPKRSALFIQSQVREHAELHLILSTIVPIPWLERCPTYKEALQEVKGKDLTTYAFLGYPVLQAADILLYRASAVPVGDDQAPHLEITREIARRFNHLYEEVFPEPKTLLTHFPRLLGTDNRKMSKSYGNCIYLSDPPETIRKQVTSMITDPSRIHSKDPGHPDICTVHAYYRAFAPEMGKDRAEACRQARIGCVACKKELAQVLEKVIAPIRERREAILKSDTTIETVINEGREKAVAIAKETMAAVMKAIRLGNRD